MDKTVTAQEHRNNAICEFDTRKIKREVAAAMEDY